MQSPFPPGPQFDTADHEMSRGKGSACICAISIRYIVSCVYLTIYPFRLITCKQQHQQ